MTGRKEFVILFFSRQLFSPIYMPTKATAIRMILLKDRAVSGFFARNLGLTIMIKVRDGLEGRINLDETFSKPIDYETKRKLDKGAVIAEEILLNAGVRREDIVKTAVIAAHPGGTVRIGNLLDHDCQTAIRNCYCMDTSIIPEPCGLPPTVMVAAMGKRLARHLCAEIQEENSTKVAA